eukprot:m.38989 g.38989  ORF g.38989 m.38989 type:complete len:61 (+) comp10274_c0_seq1:193-375(+)
MCCANFMHALSYQHAYGNSKETKPMNEYNTLKKAKQLQRYNKVKKRAPNHQTSGIHLICA